MIDKKGTKLAALAATLALASACGAAPTAPAVSATTTQMTLTVTVPPIAGQTVAPSPTAVPSIAPTQTTSPSPSPAPSSTPAATQAVAPGQVLSIHQTIGLSFIDPSHGWLLAAGDCTDSICPVTMRQTQDGGKAWAGIPAPSTEANFFPYFPWKSADPTGVSGVRFANQQDGWAYGPGFYSTHDGGQTWVNENRLVSEVAVTKGALWAIEQQETTPVIERSTDGGHSWPAVPMQPALIGWPSIATADNQTAWLYAQSNDFKAQLLTTRNGGHSWQGLPLPLGNFCTTAVLRAVSGQQLWFICGGGPATDMQRKQVYTSADGGTSWKLQADSVPSRPSIGTIPIVGQILRPTDFAAPSATTAFMALNRGTLVMTKDGGYTWTDAIPYERANGGDDPAMGPVEFANVQDGWFFVSPNRLFRTTDGGQTWQLSTVQ